MIKHTNFQLYRVHTPWWSYLENLTIDGKFINKLIRIFIHQKMCPNVLSRKYYWDVVARLRNDLITFKKIQKRWLLLYSIKSCSFKNLQYSQYKQKRLVLESLFNSEYCETFKLKNINERLILQMCSRNWEISRYSGDQLVIFQSRGDFVKLGHFDKFFFKNTREKLPQGKILELFLLDTLKIRFWLEDSIQRWTEFGPFFENQGTFFDFRKRTGEVSLYFNNTCSAEIFLYFEIFSYTKCWPDQ